MRVFGQNNVCSHVLPCMYLLTYVFTYINGATRVQVSYVMVHALLNVCAFKARKYTNFSSNVHASCAICVCLFRCVCVRTYLNVWHIT